MSEAVKVSDVGKRYGSFELQGIDFSVRQGFITGLIGPNGSGKSTLIRMMMQMVRPDSGSIELFGHRLAGESAQLRERIGYVSDENYFYDHLTIKRMKKILSPFYGSWDEEKFRGYLERFELSENKKIKELSKGMKMKFSLAVALSHSADLLIMDEPTAGLDPVFRRELLDLLTEEIQDDTRSILFSSHITNDLDRIADYIVFVNKGRLVFDETKDDVLERHVLVKGGKELLDDDVRGLFTGIRETDVGFEGLVSDRAAAQRAFGDLALLERPSLEEIVYFTSKGAAAYV
ncbi:ABC transporter ATP-binding protein [Saccharibacillus sp. CPCC 101409]|uniref:ABC transporter ATP-binding protein n=1 Tax=Saccharibacillus sp. CPCC 101409 TaxID=3058041 RepID=UPI002673D5DD|nr:ABC transporter ATP-binding protein [Saccharibacillus sp. CPCC 101409]MDO3411828.1 ABC transporter ATP-binding protein [Saccharibacillus sp. CPCC 101409]